MLDAEIIRQLPDSMTIISSATNYDGEESTAGFF